MATKQALSATVDVDVLRAAEAAVREGRAPNVSAWVNDAMRRKMEHEARLHALDVFIAAYEAEHGAITEDEVRQATRRTRARAVVVRGSSPTAARATTTRRRARGGSR
jgi:Arc/MetJ-type ribon-helix-helix transcriptional regulator